MRYRQLDVNGDYLFGTGPNGFLDRTDAVAQAILTRLLLFLEEWWEDQSEGLPYFQSIAGAYLSKGVQVIDRIVSERIQGTTDVTSIEAFTSTFNESTRQYSFSCVVNTKYGKLILEEVRL